VAIFEQWGSSKLFSSLMKGVVMGEVSTEFTENNRSRAKAVKERLERMGLAVSLGQAYEIVAVAHGHRNWPVMKASEPLVMPKIAVEAKAVTTELEQMIAQFLDFIELRQKRFAPRNKIMVHGGKLTERMQFVVETASKLKLGVHTIPMMTASPLAVDEAFARAFRKGLLLYVEDIERCDMRDGGAGRHLVNCLDEMSPGQFVILGTGKTGEIVDHAILRRAQYRHRLD
jgi:hypothetical protein